MCKMIYEENEEVADKREALCKNMKEMMKQLINVIQCVRVR